MKPLVRNLIAVLVGITLGLAIARFFVRHESPQFDSVAAATRAASPETVKSPKTQSAAETSRTAEGDREWEAYLARVLPTESPLDAARVKARLAELSALAANGNPVRAELERRWLLAHLPVESAPQLLAEFNPSPNANGDFGPWNDLFRRWATRDPAGALDALKHLPLLQHRTALRTILEQWTKSDPAASFAFIRSSQDSFVRSEGLQTAISVLAKSDPRLALSYAAQLGGANARGLTQSVIGVWAKQDAASAFEWIAQSAPPSERDRLFGQTLTQWADSHPRDAAEYALANLKGVEAAQWTPRIFQTWARHDPNAAFEALSAVPDSGVGQEIIESTARELAINAARLPGMEEGAKSALALAERMPQGKRRDAFLAGLLKYGADNDVSFALTVAPLLPEGRIREDALGHLIGVWARKDVYKTADWLNTLSPSPSTDFAVGQFASTAVELDPLAAIQWAASVQDPQKRGTFLTRVFESWRKRNPEAADTWLRDTQALSAEEKAAVAK